MQGKNSRGRYAVYAGGIIPVIWLALLTAPALSGTLAEKLDKLSHVFDNPFHIEWCDKTPKTMLIFVMAYIMGIGI